MNASPFGTIAYRDMKAGVRMADGVVFLTGITGALGGWIARRAFADGMHVRALARPSKGQDSRQRVARSLETATGSAASARLEIIEGDILDRSLDPGPIDLIIHCAACTAFNNRAASASYETNVTGLAAVLDLATRHKVPLAHVSTAYVCGNQDRLIRESDLDINSPFHNVYERTKCTGEALVHEWSSRTGLPAIVLRPGIVLGDFAQGRVARFSTLYHLMKALDSAASSQSRQQLRLVGNPRVTKNIIPVDYFADIAWRIIRRANPGTFHITHNDPITMGELSTIFSQLFNVDVQLVSEDEFAGERRTPIERICHHLMAPYRPYMVRPEPRFDRTATIAALRSEVPDPPRLDVNYFRRLLDYGRQVNWGNVAKPDFAGMTRDDPVREYFEEFLAARINQNLLPDLKKLSARFSISMKNQPAAAWWLDVQNGVLKSISPLVSEADASFIVDSKTFLEIAAGRLPPQRAFFMGLVRIGGNMELGLKVATVLAKFFAEFPFVAEAV
jgi:nucleoside-diphosphate-sugar epimerase/predicted lipid carrier protein YhbT